MCLGLFFSIFQLVWSKTTGSLRKYSTSQKAWEDPLSKENEEVGLKVHMVLKTISYLRQKVGREREKNNHIH